MWAIQGCVGLWVALACFVRGNLHGGRSDRRTRRRFGHVCVQDSFQHYAARFRYERLGHFRRISSVNRIVPLVPHGVHEPLLEVVGPRLVIEPVWRACNLIPFSLKGSILAPLRHGNSTQNGQII